MTIFFYVEIRGFPPTSLHRGLASHSNVILLSKVSEYYHNANTPMSIQTGMVGGENFHLKVWVAKAVAMLVTGAADLVILYFN